MPQLSIPVGSTATIDYNAKPNFGTNAMNFITGDLTGINSFMRIISGTAHPLDYAAVVPFLGVGARGVNAVGRSAIEMMGISKGMPGLGSLLPKGSIPYAASMGSAGVQNAALATTQLASKLSASGLSSQQSAAANPITETFGLSAILSRMLKGSELGYGSEVWTKKQIKDIMALAGKSGELNDPTLGGAAIKRTPPWKKVDFSGAYSGRKHEIILPWRTRSDTVVHEGMHALDTTKYHWSYDDLFKYLHSVGRSDEANSLFNFYQRYTTPEDSPGALYAGIESRLRDKDFSLFARFRGFMEGNAEDKTHVAGKKLIEKGDKEGALRIGTPYAQGTSYYNRLSSLLKGSMDEGYEFYRHPSFIEGLLAVSHNMPAHTRQKWEVWKEWLVSYGIDGSNLPYDLNATEKLLQEALANGWAMGGSIPKFHNGGEVNTKFAGGETMALLKDKEMVFTQDQMTALGSMVSGSNTMTPTSITYAPVINAAPGMDEEMLANLVMVKLGTATNVRYKANGSSGMRVIK